MTVLVRLFIFREGSKNIEKDSDNQNNERFKNYAIMFLLEIFSNSCALLSAFSEYETESVVSSRELYINDAIEIILLSIITYYFLKYKY